jgi:hypothetical protein
MSKFDNVFKQISENIGGISVPNNLNNTPAQPNPAGLTSTNPVVELVKSELSAALLTHVRRSPQTMTEQQAQKLLQALNKQPEFTRALEKAAQAVPGLKPAQSVQPAPNN